MIQAIPHGVKSLELRVRDLHLRKGEPTSLDGPTNAVENFTHIRNNIKRKGSTALFVEKADDVLAGALG